MSSPSAPSPVADYAFDAKMLFPRWTIAAAGGLALIGLLLFWLFDGMQILMGSFPAAGDLGALGFGVLLMFFGGAGVLVALRPPQAVPVVVSDQGLVVHEAKHLVKVHVWSSFDGRVERQPTRFGTTLVFTLRTTFRATDGQLRNERVTLEGVDDAVRAEREILERITAAQASERVPG